MNEQTSVRELKGIGEKTEQLLAKLGISTVGDLIGYYPREYDVYEPVLELEALETGKKQAVMAVITSGVSVKNLGGRKCIVTLKLQSKKTQLNVAWFNMPFLRSQLKKGSVWILRGNVRPQGSHLTMDQPEIFTAGGYEKICASMQPKYPLTAGLSNNLLTRTLRSCLTDYRPSEWLPETLLLKYELMPLSSAVVQIHFPESRDTYLEARRRLAFDEFFMFILCMQFLKTKDDQLQNLYPMRMGWQTEKVMENLPYHLTGAQLAVWNDMEQDLASAKMMNRLIQGDVGSGKTILAFLAMIMAAENGYQSALMAPTEVLAAQHYESFTRLLEENGMDKSCAVLLTGSARAPEKRTICEGIRSGQIRYIIGTHALIQEKVTYRNLSLIITDEQHRFGVRQREFFADKGIHPNIAVMSATPIPRTLAMILYGDLDVSVLNEKPASRLPVKNCVVGPSYRTTAYRFIDKELEKGHQIYMICPMVEESEGIEAENVLTYTAEMKKRFPDYRVEALHGRMKARLKDEIMTAYAAGDIQVLVSTTVVEVGVNVPNATVMLVENAERFGLAQLHQLRGRIGRGRDQSYCIFMYSDGEKEAPKRLEILNKTNDGFAIADEDLRLRGPGDFFGVRQSGIMDFRIGDVCRDSELLKQAAAEVRLLLFDDPDLKKQENSVILRKLEDYKLQKLKNVIL